MESMLNDHVGERKLKKEIMEALNQNYLTLLREHLKK